MTTRHYRVGTSYLGGFGDDAVPPDGAIECPQPPHGDAIWFEGAWVYEAPAPILTKPQFEWLLAVSGLDEVWEAVETEQKKQTDRSTYATLRMNRNRGSFELDITLGFIDELAPVIAAVAPGVDLSTETVTALWEQAALQ